MITKIVRNSGTTEQKWIYDIRLLSTDDKPVEDIPNGSICLEINTGKKFMFDQESGTWNELDTSILLDVDGINY